MGFFLGNIKLLNRFFSQIHLKAYVFEQFIFRQAQNTAGFGYPQKIDILPLFSISMGGCAPPRGISGYRGGHGTTYEQSVS